MNQILLGVSLPYLVCLVLYARRRCRASLRLLLLGPASMALSSLWAVAPDLPRLFGHHELYHRLSRDPRCNIFYWHYSIDLMESSSSWFLAGIVLILGSLLFVAWRELRLTERMR